MNIIPFDYSGKVIRTTTIENEPWWVAIDICRALGLADPRTSINLLDEDERDVLPVMDSLGRKQDTFIVNEPGLYSLIFRSRKKAAKKFKRWIAHEVIPAIRKTGGYQASNVPQNFADALLLASNLEREKQTLIAQREKDQPKVALADAITASKRSVSVGDYAKAISNEELGVIGRNNFLAWMRFEKMIDQKNMPYQRYKDNQWLDVQERVYENKNTNGPIPCFTTMVTGKGQVAILKKFRRSDTAGKFLNKSGR